MATRRGQSESRGDDPFRTGISKARETETAIGEVLDQTRADSAALTLVFFSPRHDASVVSDHLDRRTGPKGLAGTTAGELSSSHGFSTGGIVGVSLRASDVRATIDVVPGLDDLSLVSVDQLPSRFAGRFGLDRDDLDPDRHLWLLLADAEPGVEDLLTPFFVRGAPPTRLVGGSLGGATAFDGARIVFHGRTYTDAAALILLEYDRPFGLLHHQHMTFREPNFRVTEVSDGGRILESLDGTAPAEVYSDALGLSRDRLDRSVLAEHPLGFRFRGRPLVCSIERRLDRGRFRMAKTLHPGDELQIMEPGDLIGSTRETLAERLEEFRERHGRDCRGALFFHCLGRYLEAEKNGTTEQLAEALAQVPCAGLNTYGEQYGAMHTNHTLTGALFG